MSRFNSSHEKILVYLSKFKYLTNSQLQTLGVMKSTRKINERKNELQERGLITSVSYWTAPEMWKFEYVHYLVWKGKKLLMEEFGLEDEEIRMPKGKVNRFSKDYFHRKYTIDFHILLWKRTNDTRSELLFFDSYFDKLGNNRVWKNLKAKTKLDAGSSYLIADGIFGLKLFNGKEELYIVEVYNGKDSLRVYKKLKKHAEAIEQGSLNVKYNFQHPYRILCVFQLKSTMKAVMRRMDEDLYFQFMKKHFLFKDLEGMYSNQLIYGRFLMGGETTNMISSEAVAELKNQLLASF